MKGDAVYSRLSLSAACMCLLILSACSQLSEEECLYMSWHARGERTFLSGYQPGRLMWSAINNIREVESIVRSSTYRIQNIENKIDRLYVELEDTSLTDKQRSEIRNEIRWARRDIENERDRRRTNELRIPELKNRCNEARDRVESLGFVIADVCY